MIEPKIFTFKLSEFRRNDDEDALLVLMVAACNDLSTCLYHLDQHEVSAKTSKTDLEQRINNSRVLYFSRLATGHLYEFMYLFDKKRIRAIFANIAKCLDANGKKLYEDFWSLRKELNKNDRLLRLRNQTIFHYSLKTAKQVLQDCIVSDSYFSTGSLKNRRYGLSDSILSIAHYNLLEKDTMQNLGHSIAVLENLFHAILKNRYNVDFASTP